MSESTKYRPNYDWSKLRGKIREVVGTEQRFAELIGRSKKFICDVFSNKAYFDIRDLDKAKNVLEISDEEFCDFFCLKGSQMGTK